MWGKGMHIRDATIDDAQGIMFVYNDAVEHTTAIWNETLVDEANRQSWLLERQGKGYPVLVAVDGTD
jgi:phosphinothricin acetyltransferase